MGDHRHFSSNDDSSERSSAEQESTPEARSTHQHASASISHRRTLSGTLSAFLTGRPSPNPEPRVGRVLPKALAEDEPPPSPRSGGAMAAAIHKNSMRRRKGSLRKTALLGTGKIRMDSRERRGSSLDETKILDGEQSDGSSTDAGTLSNPPSPRTPVDMSTPRPLPVPPPVPMVTHPVHGDPSKILASQGNQPFREFQRPLTAQSTASTTDEEDSPTSPISLPPASHLETRLSADSYFPPQPRLARPLQTSPKSPSPLAALPPSIPSSTPSEWDYSETRWWGWFILTVTWIIFVVGMGSCFEVWSWAWDVGETPYAPPELEDDPTLPIVGYYPALIILTSVMAWVWVTVAWVGMKYFKHANISGDEEAS